jgi:hypothetical protein
MDNWKTQGCSTCRDEVYSGRSRAQGSLCRYLCTGIANHAHLCRCDACGCWWIENEREAHVISEAEARTTFVEYFTALDPSSAR